MIFLNGIDKFKRKNKKQKNVRKKYWQKILVVYNNNEHTFRDETQIDFISETNKLQEII